MYEERKDHKTIDDLNRSIDFLQTRSQAVLDWGGMGTWAYDFENGVFEIDNRFFENFDLDIDPPFTLESLKPAVHPDDLLMFQKAFDDFFANRTNDDFSLTNRFRTRKGDWIWFYGHGGITERSETGGPRLAAGTIQNVMEVKKVEQEIQRRDHLLSASNQAARILLEDAEGSHDVQIRMVLELLGAATDVDRVYIWKNYYGSDGRQYTTQIHEWSLGAEPQQGNEWTVDRPVEEAIPTWESIFREGKCVNNLVRLMPLAEQEQLAPQGIISILVAPIMFKDEFWGFIGFDDCQKERIWSDSEAGILKSAGMIVAAAIMRQQAEKELIVARDLAEAGTKAKSEFLARMSHEIRTPMNAILGMTYLCLQTEVNDRQRDYLQKTQNATINLLGIIDDILDFSKIEAGKVELENIPIQLSKVLQDVVDVVGVKIHDKGLQFVSHIDSSVFDELLGDPLRIRQVLTNLINNAVKFTDKGSISVTVHCVNEEENNKDDSRIWLEFAVKDSGIGMTSDQVARLFQSFTQADGSTTRKYGGTGLGLVISKRFVELMGGRIWVESEAGIGSTFRFRVPFTKYVTIGKEKMLEMAENLSRKLKDSRILIVDDDEATRLVLYDLLRTLSNQVDVVDSGDAALAALIRATQVLKPYDIMLLDWKMPRMNGLETIRLIRSNESIVEPRIVMISAYDRFECLRQSKGLGLDGFLVKPVTKRILEETLVDVLERRDKPIIEEEAVPIDLSGAEILLAEDNKINQMVASELLRGFGVNLTIVSNGLEAVEAVKNKDFDLVLMDVQMPDMDGLTATKEIRKLPRAGATTLPILAMTANALDTDFHECLQAGMNDHLAKPIDAKRLRSALTGWIVRNK